MPLQTTIFGVRFRFVPTSKFKWSSFDQVRCSINSDAITEELKSKIDPAVPQQFCSKVVKFLFKKVLSGLMSYQSRQDIINLIDCGGGTMCNCTLYISFEIWVVKYDQ